MSLGPCGRRPAAGSIGEVLIGEPVAVSETDQGYMAVYDFGLLLGYIGKGSRTIRSPERWHPTAQG